MNIKVYCETVEKLNTSRISFNWLNLMRLSLRGSLTETKGPMGHSLMVSQIN